eukprot:TRINITY_DN767_c0_g1_i2.p2 TRINITY_DN767_c0_g1~~TRINITY_DN767_c0_g1_i2.p2  ORF type:complete len:155 (+),score=58.02 TRINITY_DN767_c0_g1_i2:70-534(+)
MSLLRRVFQTARRVPFVPIHRSSIAGFKTIIATENAPKAIGPYSQAVKANGFLFVSGCLGLDPKTNDFSGSDIKSQSETIFQNMEAILKAGGCTFNDVVKTTVLLADISDYPVVNEIYAKYFKKEFPARAAFAVKTLPKHALVEIEAIAVVPRS